MTARWVIHVVGPHHRAGETDRSLLTSCYSRALAVADELGARPSRSRWSAPASTAGRRTTRSTRPSSTLRSTSTRVEEARMIAFDAETYDALVAAVDG